MIMRKLTLIAVLLCLLGCASTQDAQKFVGPGPDPACGGTELSITEQDGKVLSIDQTYFASNRTIVERFVPVGNGVWEASLSLYSSRWQNDEPLDEQHLMKTRTFRTDKSKPIEAALKEEFGYGEIDWEKEPVRLLDHYRSNRREFERIEE